MCSFIDIRTKASEEMRDFDLCGVSADGAKRMSKGEQRRFTAEQKLEILREAEQPGVTVSEVCRRNGLAPSVFYRWRAVAQSGSAVALKQDAKRTPRKDDRQARQEVEMARLRAVIAEITAENLELKKKI